MIFEDREEEDYLMHYGILRKSGRYPWGSGKTPLQRSVTFTSMVADFRSQGMSDVDIAAGLGMTTSQLRNTTSIANAEKKAADIHDAQALKNKGWSTSAIARKMNRNESYVRSLLQPGEYEKTQILKTTADMLRRQVEEKEFVDVGTGVGYKHGVSDTRIGAALAILKDEGYVVEKVQTPGLGTGGKKMTTIKVLAKPGHTYASIKQNIDKIQGLEKISEGGGRTKFGMLPPLPVSSKRVAVRYGEEGGKDADGLIEVRPGAKDLSLGNSNYAQVRINVDGTHYIKGVAVYKNDLPEGVDIRFNTNKKDTGNKLDALKPMTEDQENPFGAMVRQITRDDDDGNPVELLSAMNIVHEEGDWDKWSRTLSRQTLSKQSPKLAKQLLDQAYDRKKKEFDDIMSLTNPTVRAKLLNTFSEDSDSSAIYLKAASLPRSSWHVILPFKMKETEIYAPNYEDGERVALVRFPHAGTFEIPELTVNNKHPAARATIGRAKDAIGINAKVAEHLSGADFDGDAVLVIPNRDRAIKRTSPLEGLKDFHPREEYKGYEGMPVMTPQIKGHQMGLISNLITDMTLKDANRTELAAAVRHSMVVIDAENHKLNYKLSAQRNGIPALMKKYQGRTAGGGATLISRSGSSRIDVPEKRLRRAKESEDGGGPIDKATGKLVYVPTGRTRLDSKGRPVLVTQRSVKLRETDDAHTLSSGTDMEVVYADHSNRLKALANTARKEMVNTPPAPYSPSANKIYAKEVQEMNAALSIAIANSPRERQAQVFGNALINARMQANPDLPPEHIKRMKAQVLIEARRRMNAKKELIVLEDRHWEAIQAGAITPNRLKNILNNTDLEAVKKRTMPTAPVLMSGANLTKAKAMQAAGRTQAEIASALGMSVTTLKKGLKTDEDTHA